MTNYIIESDEKLYQYITKCMMDEKNLGFDFIIRDVICIRELLVLLNGIIPSVLSLIVSDYVRINVHVDYIDTRFQCYVESHCCQNISFEYTILAHSMCVGGGNQCLYRNVHCIIAKAFAMQAFYVELCMGKN